MPRKKKVSARSARRSLRGVFERPRGSGIWWVRYHDQHGREHRERVGPKGLAGEVYRKRKTEIAECRFFPERIRQVDVLLSRMIDDVLDRSTALRAYAEYERAGRYWKAALGSRPLREIVPGDVERYKSRRIKEVSAATVNRELMFLKRVFNLALKDGKLDRNPVREVRFFKEDNERVRWLTEEEETRLRAALGDEDWLKVSFALNTGFRQASQFRLLWRRMRKTTSKNWHSKRQKPLTVQGLQRERATGVEPATSSLGSWHSTTELRPRLRDRSAVDAGWQHRSRDTRFLDCRDTRDTIAATHDGAFRLQPDAGRDPRAVRGERAREGGIPRGERRRARTCDRARRGRARRRQEAPPLRQRRQRRRRAAHRR